MEKKSIKAELQHFLKKENYTSVRYLPMACQTFTGHAEAADVDTDSHWGIAFASVALDGPIWGTGKQTCINVYDSCQNNQFNHSKMSKCIDSITMNRYNLNISINSIVLLGPQFTSRAALHEDGPVYLSGLCFFF